MRRVASIALVTALAACSGSHAGPGAVPIGSTSVNQRLASTVTSEKLVYVSSQATTNGAVYVYTRKGQAKPPVATITDGISSPAGLAVDSNGNLYVANSGNSTVTVYPPGQTTPSVTYTSGVSSPAGVAVGHDGTVYVANEFGSGSGAGTVTEYPSGSTAPSVTIDLPDEYAFSVALDSANRLYVSWFSLSTYQMEIYEYPTEGSSNGQNLGLDLLTYTFPAYAIAFDPSGNLIVPVESLTHNPPRYLAVFRPGATKPRRKINEASLLDVVTGIAFEPGNKKIFYVSAENDHDWLKLTYPKTIPRDVVNVGVPTGLALSP